MFLVRTDCFVDAKTTTSIKGLKNLNKINCSLNAGKMHTNCKIHSLNLSYIRMKYIFLKQRNTNTDICLYIYSIV